jgi:uncharacterized protein YaaW (UPF0174 family)
MTTDEVKTIEMLEWAKNIASENEAVAMFWNELCRATKEPTTALPSRVLSKLKLYGGNSIANACRGEGVAYTEIAYDVAKILKPLFHDKSFSEDNVESCEAYILTRMEVKEDDIAKICETINKTGTNQAIRDQIKKASVKTTAAGGATVLVGKGVAKVAAKRAVIEASKQVTKKAAQKVAQEVAKQAARQLLIRMTTALNIIMSLWIIVDIAGPARRVIIPGVTYTALLRRLYIGSIRGL